MDLIGNADDFVSNIFIFHLSLLDRIYRIYSMVGFLSFLKKLRKSQSGCAGVNHERWFGYWRVAMNPTSGRRTDGGFALSSGKGEKDLLNPWPRPGFERVGLYGWIP